MSSVPVLGFTKADGRPLSAHDHYYFDNCFAPLNAIFSISKNGFPKSDKKFVDAFDRVVQKSPLLQTHIEGSDTFRTIDSSRWPKLVIADPVKDDGDLITEAPTVVDKHVRAMTAGGQEAQREAVYSLMLMRSPNRIALLIITPHHFVDGTGLGIICIKLFQYARVPRILWPALDVLSTEEVPTFWEMSLKQDFPRLNEVLEKTDVTTSAKCSDSNFCFANYDMSDPTQLTCFLDRTMSSVHVKTLRKCQSMLRSNHGGKLGIASAFGALAVKTLSHLLKAAGHDIPPGKSNLLCTLGVDARVLGQWGDDRDTKHKFPVIANYAFSSGTQISFEDAMGKSVEEIALQITDTISRIRRDVDFRILTIKSSYSVLLPSSNMFVGCSSVILPRGWTVVSGMRDVHVDARIDFGAVPHVWFYVVTSGNSTQMDVDIKLPLELSDRQVEDAIQDAVRGSALEILF